MRRGIAWLAGAGILASVGAVLAGPENVVFPADYRDAFEVVAVRDHHLGGNSVVVIYANPIAVESARLGGPLASGSVFLMEIWRSRMENDQVVRDESGRLIRDTLGNINMMEKRDGWGEGYPAEWRNGNWEFATFTSTGDRREANLQGCFECHKPLGDAGFDHVFVVGVMRQGGPDV